MSISDPFGNVPGNKLTTIKWQKSLSPGYGSQGSEYDVLNDWPSAARARTANISCRITGLNKEKGWRHATHFARSITKFTAEAMTKNVTNAGSPAWVDKYKFSSWDVVGNDPRLNEFQPFFSQGSSHIDYEQNSYSRAVTECLNKLSRNSGNIAENLATSKRTFNMLSENILTLSRLLMAVKRGQFNLIPRIFGIYPGGSGKALASTHLQIKYGWAPLLRDTYQLAKDLIDGFENPLIITARRTIPFDAEYKFQTVADTRTLDWTVHSKGKTVCQLSGLLDMQSIDTLNRLSLVNPLALGWELVPFSFVLDWVAPIGNTLEALSADIGLRFLDGYTSVRADCSSEIKIGPTIYSWDDCSPGTHRVQRFGFRRTALTDFPRPEFYVKSPFKSSNTQTAVALLVQMRR